MLDARQAFALSKFSFQHVMPASAGSVAEWLFGSRDGRHDGVPARDGCCPPLSARLPRCADNDD